MSTTTDNKVVEMRFNNQQFEKNAKESISTLDKLKQALKFDRSSVKSLDDLQRNTKNFNLDQVTRSVDKVSDHFSALGVAGMTVINRLTNAAIDFSKRAVDAMSGGLSGGFAKYSAMTDAVQVMVINSGESIEYVNGLMGKLQKYVDDTSYSFEQMTRTMGNFAAVGLDLETAEEMVEGIANWSATAGVNAVKAEAAFREVSSAISKGYLDLRDAQTLMSLNMFTPDFRRLTLATAAAFGTIKEEAGKYWADIGTGAKEKWVEVTESNLTSTLRGKWFTTEIWEEVMHLYADTSDTLSELDKQLLEAAGLSEDFGQKAFDAAYEAKTFADAVGAIKDTLTTGWSNTFEHIFGNYKVAAVFWTDLASSIQEIIGAMGDARNELIGGWADLGGRAELLGTVFEIMKNIHLAVIPIVEAFQEVFGVMDSWTLYEATIMFRDFIRSLEPTDEALFALKDAFINIFSVIRMLLDPVQILAAAFWNLIVSVSKIIGFIAGLVGKLVEVIAYSGILYNVVDGIVLVVDTAGKILITAGLALAGFILQLKELGIFSAVFNSIRYAVEIAGAVIFVAIQSIVGAITNLVNLFSDIKKFGIETVLKTTDGALKAILETVVKFKDAVTTVFNFIGDKVKSLFKVKDAIKEISKETEEGLLRANKSQEVFKNTLKSFSLVDKIKAAFGNFRFNVTDKITEGTQALSDFFKTLGNGKIAIAGALAGVAGLALKMTVFSGKGKGGIGGGLIGTLFDASGLSKKVLLIGALSGAIALLYKKIRSASGAEGAAEESSGVFSKLFDSFKNFGKASGDAEETVGLFGKIKNAIVGFGTSVTSTLSPAIDAIKEFFHNLDWGKAILISFAATVATTFAYLTIGIGSLPLLILSLSRTIWGLGSAIRNWSIWGVDTFGDTAIKIGQSILYLAGAMWVMAKIPADRFVDVANALKIFMGSMLAITALSSILAVFGKLEGVWNLGIMLLSMSTAMLVVAAALKLIEKTDPVGMFKRFAIILGTVALLLGEVIAAVWAINKLAPKLLLEIAGIAAIATAVAILAGALLVLSFIPVERLRASGEALAGVIFAYAALIYSVGSLAGNVRGAVVSLLALVSVAMAFKIMVDALIAIGDSGLGIEHIKKNWDKYAEVFAVLATLCLLATGMSFALKTAGQDLAGAGIAVLAIAASMALIAKTIGFIASIKDKIDKDKLLAACAVIVAAGGGIFLALKGLQGLGKEALKASLSLFAVITTFTVLAGLGTLLSLLPPAMFQQMLQAIGALSLCVSLILAVSKLAENVKAGPIVAMTVLLLSVVGSIIAIGKYGGDLKTIGTSAGALFAVLIALAISFRQVSKIASDAKVGPILSMVLALGVIAGSIALLSKMQIPNIAASVGAIIVTLSAFGYAFKELKKFSSGWVDLKAIGLLITAVGVIGGSLALIATQNWGQIAAAAGGVSVVLLALAYSYKIITDNFSGAVKVNYGALIGLVAAVGVIGYSLSEVAKHPWQQILAAFGAITLTLAALAGVYALISELSSAGNTLATIGGALGFDILAAGIFVLAKALKELQGITWDSIADGVKVIAQFTVAILALSAIFGLVPEIMGVGIAIIVLAFMGFAVAANVLAEAIVKVAPAIGDLSIKLSVASVVISSAIGNVVEAFGGFVIKLAEAKQIVAEGIAIMINAFGDLVLKVSTGISTIIFAIANLVTALANAFATITPMILTFAQNVSAGFVIIGTGIGAGLAMIITTFFTTLIAAVGKGISDIIALIQQRTPEVSAAGGSLLDSLINTAYQKLPWWAKAVTGLVVGGINQAKEPAKKEMANCVSDMADAFDAGAKAKQSAFNASGASIAESFLNGLRNFLGWHSNPDFVVGGGSYSGLLPDTGSAFASGTASILPGVAANGASIGSAFGNNIFSFGIPGIDNLVSYAADKLGGLLAGFGSLGLDSDVSIVDLPMEDQERALRSQKERGKAAAKANSQGILQSWREGYNEYIQNQRKQKFKGGDANALEKEENLYRGIWRENHKISEDAEDAFGGGGGDGGGGGGGGGASEAAEEARELFDVWKDGGKIIQKTAETFGSTYEKLGFVHPLKMGEAAVTGLATKLYDLSVAGVDAATLAQVTTEEKLADMKELFDEFVNGVADSLAGAGDVFGSFTENAATPINKWIKDLDKQEVSIDRWVGHIEELAKRSGDFNLVRQFMDMGPTEDATLRKLLSSTDDEMKKLSKSITDYADADGKKLEDRVNRLIASASYTTLNGLETIGDLVNKYAGETLNNLQESLNEAAEEATETTQEAVDKGYVVISHGSAAVINEIGKVVKANGEMGQSAFDAAKVTRQAYSEMEDVYLSAKKAVEDAIGGSIDILNKFDTETEIDPDEIMDNAEGSLKAWETMITGMGTLAERGLNTDFIMDKLVTMGEGAYGYVQAMLEWSGEEIQKFNDMFERSLSLPSELGEKLGRDFASAVALGAQGMFAGLGNDATYEEAKKAAQGIVDAMIQGTPFDELGIAYAEGASKSLQENNYQVTEAGVKEMTQTFIEWKSEAEGGMYTVYECAIDGGVKAIRENYYKINDAMHEQDEAFIQNTMDDFEEHSPSRVFQRIGKFLDLGLAKGITDNTDSISNAAVSMSSSAIDSMRAVVGHIMDIINGEVMVDPTIRPVVDLSGVQAGAAAANSMFGGTSYSMTRGINVMGRSDSVNDMISQMMAAQGGMMPVAGGSPINMYVYAAPGQSEEEIANIVEQKLMFRINRQGAAWT